MRRLYARFRLLPHPQDFGYPQDTSSEALVQFVHNKPVVVADPKVLFIASADP